MDGSAAGRSRAVFLNVLDGDGLGDDSLLLLLQSDTQLKLGLGLGCPVQLLVDSNVSRLYQDVSTGRIGVSLKDYVGVGGEVKESSNLRFQVRMTSRTEEGVSTDGARGETEGDSEQ